MIYIKKYGKASLFFLGITLFGVLILNTLSYFNIIGSGFVKVFSYIIFVLSFFVSGFVNGKHSKKKGWLEGLKYGLLLLLIIQIINFFVFKVHFNSPYLIFELLSLLIIVFGSMIGISKRI